MSVEFVAGFLTGIAVLVLARYVFSSIAKILLLRHEVKLREKRIAMLEKMSLKTWEE